ncbi:hypothetical protein ACYUJ6_13205 [Clostridium sp. JNZ X4-2]
MKAIEIVESSDDFKNYLINLLNLTDLQYSTLTNKSNEKITKYMILNSMNEKHDILDGHYCFINMDLIDGKSNDFKIHGYIITYGLGSKNTVTISSLDYNSGFVYCLQRDIVQNGEKIIESQEIPINMVLKDIDELYAAMIAITLGLMEDKYMYVLLKNRRFKILI